MKRSKTNTLDTSPRKSVRVWRRLCPARWEDAWEERLQCFGRERLCVHYLPGGKTIRLEIYDVTDKEGRLLEKQFGGTVQTVSAASWQPAPAAGEKPMRIRSQLVITGRKENVDTLRREHPSRTVLLIPAAMAFGTGDHPTTAGCLRFLADTARDLPRSSWNFLDLGTGTGILALAASALGASSSLGIDFDAHAVRTAKENARLNRNRKVKFLREDVLKWTPPGRYEVIAANLFSELLIEAAPRIVKALAEDGTLILSGILRTQEKETLRAFRASGLKAEEVLRKGKWIAAKLRVKT
jgi:ribosomal protein L11 methyltransferase